MYGNPSNIDIFHEISPKNQLVSTETGKCSNTLNRLRRGSYKRMVHKNSELSRLNYEFAE